MVIIPKIDDFFIKVSLLVIEFTKIRNVKVIMFITRH